MHTYISRQRSVGEESGGVGHAVAEKSPEGQSRGLGCIL